MVLSNDLWYIIVAYLDEDDRQRWAEVDSRTQAIATDEKMWAMKCLINFGSLSKTCECYQQEYILNDLLQSFHHQGQKKLQKMLDTIAWIKSLPQTAPLPFDYHHGARCQTLQLFRDKHRIRLANVFNAQGYYNILYDMGIVVSWRELDNILYYHTFVYERKYIPHLYTHYNHTFVNSSESMITIALDNILDLEDYIQRAQANGYQSLHNRGFDMSDPHILQHFEVVKD